MPPTVMDVRSLHRLLPVWLRISTLVRRIARRSGMGCDNLLTMLGHGIISEQTPNEALSGSANMQPVWSYPWNCLPCQWAPHRGKGRPDIFEGPLLPSGFSSFSDL